MNDLLNAFLLVGVLGLPVLLMIPVLRSRMNAGSMLVFLRNLLAGLAMLPLLAPWLATIMEPVAASFAMPRMVAVPLRLELLLDPATIPAAGDAMLSLSAAMFLAWLLVAAVLVSGCLVEQWRFRRIARKADRLDPWVLPVQLPTSVRAARTEQECPAFVTGMFRPVIVLPSSLLDDEDGLANNESVAAVLLHELAHIENHDFVWLFSCSVLVCLCWPVLPLWFLHRQLVLQAELAADARALQGTDPDVRRRYAAQLISAMKRHSSFPVGLPTFTSRHLRRAHMRIRNILNNRSESATPARRRMAGATAMLLMLPFVGMQVAIAKSDLEFIAPIGKGELTSAYGERHNPFTGKKAHHNGIDIRAALGTPVMTPAGGKVVFAGMKGDGYGIVVEIMHLGGFRSLYAHLESTDLEAGDVVEKGVVLGRVGVTGQSTGPHLHVELYQDGKRVDPQAYLPVHSQAE